MTQETESPDMPGGVNLDPPFNSNATYNILFAERDGTRAGAQIRAFEDTWTWDKAAASAYYEVVEAGGEPSSALRAFRTLLGDNDVLAYLSMMAPRLVELRRVMRPTGSIYLHCDPTASHYLKILMDAVFGPEHFRNEIVWRRTGSNSAARRFGPLHQTIFYYVRTKQAPYYPQTTPYTSGYVRDFFTEEDERGRYRPVLLTGPGRRTGASGQPWRHYNPTNSGRHWQPSSYVYDKYRELTDEDLAQYPLITRLDHLDEVGLIHWPHKANGVPNYKFYLADAPGVYMQDIWAYQPGTEGAVYGHKQGIDEDVKWLGGRDAERLPYPTQKPEGLLSRIIRSSTQKGDVVLDPFCGCGTAVVAAQRLERNWIGVDITALAVNAMKRRLDETFPGTVRYDVIGEPTTYEDAQQLAATDEYQFQWWALGLVHARPTQGKKGSDRGIDGRLFFHDEGPRGETKQVIFSVKAGKNVGVEMVRDLGHVVTRENAQIGVLITMSGPTQPMRAEVAGAGFYQSPWGRHPRLQVLTVQELLNGTTIDMPPAGTNVTFTKAVVAPPPPAERDPLF